MTPEPAAAAALMVMEVPLAIAVMVALAGMPAPEMGWPIYIPAVDATVTVVLAVVVPVVVAKLGVPKVPAAEEERPSVAPALRVSPEVSRVAEPEPAARATVIVDPFSIVRLPTSS